MSERLNFEPKIAAKRKTVPWTWLLLLSFIKVFEGKLLYDSSFTCFHEMIEKQQQEPSKNLIQIKGEKRIKGSKRNQMFPTLCNHRR